jgi:hypothetical protein
MKHFNKIWEGLNLSPIKMALQSNPSLWDEHQNRRLGEKSPHKEMQDIWVRANDKTKYDEAGCYKGFNDMHYPIFYPAWNILPLRQLVMGLMAKMEATHLGTILITKIPAGGKILPHIDRGWNATFFNCKLYIPLQANPDCWNRCEDETVVMQEGDVWYFDNQVEHEVQNNGTDDRITLIICMRCE